MSHTVVRAVLIALVTLFVVSAVLTPKLNPVTRGTILGTENAWLVWGEMTKWRVAMVQARHYEEGWPKDINRYAPQNPVPFVTVTSPRPYRLQANVARQSDLGAISGTEVFFDFNPISYAWTCSAGQPPMPAGLLPMQCTDDEPTEEIEPFGWLRTLYLACGLVFAAAAAMLLMRHPSLSLGQLRPERLRRTPVAGIPRLDQLLRLTGWRQSTLQAAEVPLANWLRALRYAAATDMERVSMLAGQLAARSKPSSDWAMPGAVFEWLFPVDLPVTLDRCLVFVPARELDEVSLLHHLRVAQTGADVMLILSPHTPDDPWSQLQAYCEDRANLTVMVDSPSQTEWLLSSQPVSVFLRLLAAQLRVTRISPYQTRGGVTRSGVFFGRHQLLARVVNREPANYLVVGGRQLGKSSLLKAVQRRLDGHPHVICHYVSLRDHRLAPRLALQFGLDAATPLDAIITHLQATYAGKRLFLLIDEADMFFREESQHGYHQLSALRALSDEGRCWFMLAGFWDLYATAVLDYQSPLRNFGEVLTIGGLEAAACAELATVPLSRLRLGFASNRLVDQLVEASGQRANLVAILCQECLEVLQPGERAIEQRHLTQAFSSQAVQDALAGWGRLSHDEAACRLDRIVVYHTALHGATSLAELAGLLESHGIDPQPDALRRALDRLQLAYILKREQASYRFAIPLFAKQFEPQETTLLLRQELVVGAK